MEGATRSGFGSDIGESGGGDEMCAHPECEYAVNSDPTISPGYCCEKCQGLHHGEDWAEGGKRHYKTCDFPSMGHRTITQIGSHRASYNGIDSAKI